MTRYCQIEQTFRCGARLVNSKATGEVRLKGMCARRRADNWIEVMKDLYGKRDNTALTTVNHDDRRMCLRGRRSLKGIEGVSPDNSCVACTHCVTATVFVRED